MTSYAGLDVSQRETQICVTDERGAVSWTGKAASEPEALAAALRERAPGLARAVIESGTLSGWLCSGLVGRGPPASCIDARAAHGALKQRRSETDLGDAEGLARLAQVGWFKVARVKSRSGLELRALLVARERLVRVHRDLGNQIRGLPKPSGLVPGVARGRRSAARAEALLGAAPGLRPAIRPSLAARASVADELAKLDGAPARRAAADPACRRLTSVPGVGAVTAASLVSVVDDPARFARADQVAAHLGLTPRRWQSGEVDRRGGASKAGDGMARRLLHEAADSIPARVRRPRAPRGWALRLRERVGGRKARVAALARKLAVLVHKLWRRGAGFDRGDAAAAA